MKKQDKDKNAKKEIQPCEYLNKILDSNNLYQFCCDCSCEIEDILGCTSESGCEYRAFASKIPIC